MEEQAARDRIITSAGRIFSEKGFHGASIRRIAESADVSLPMLYYYFGNKEGLYKYVLINTLERIQTFLRQKAPEELAPKDRLTKFLQAIAAFYYSNRHLFLLANMEIFFQPGQEGKGPLPQECMQCAGIILGTIAGIIHKGIETGDFREVDADTTAMMLLGSTYFLFLEEELRGASAETLPAEKKISQLVEILFKGIEAI